MSLTIIAQSEAPYAIDESVRWVLQHVDDWRERTECPRIDVGRFHPSDLALEDAAIIARFNGTAVQFTEPAQKLRIFDNGHSVHARWGRYLKKSGLSLKHKKKFWLPRLRLIGTCDEIIANPATGEVTVVELKSINPYGFQQLQEPRPEHVDQLHCYMAGLRIHTGILLYECKGTQKVKLFRCDFERERWLRIEARLRRLKEEADALPRAESKHSPEVIEASHTLLDAIAEAEQLERHPQSGSEEGTTAVVMSNRRPVHLTSSISHHRRQQRQWQ